MTAMKLRIEIEQEVDDVGSLRYGLVCPMGRLRKRRSCEFRHLPCE